MSLGLSGPSEAAGGGRASRDAAPPSKLDLPRQTIAVSSFTALPQFDLEQGGPSDVGGGLAAMLTTALIESDRFLVVERARLEKAMSEQQLSINRLVSPESRVSAGALIGAQWIVTGHVTEFGSSTRGSGVSFGTKVGSGVLGVAPRKRIGTVAVDVRVIDSTTGAVVTSMTARESIASRSIGLSASYRDLDLASSKFVKTSVGRAARATIESIVARLVELLEEAPWSGRIVDFAAGEVVLNAGSDAGIRVGQQFEINRQTKALTDPVTGEVLGFRQHEVGIARITEVQERVAFGDFTATGSALTPTRNDIVTLLEP